jgi:Flp pilus assembly protein TadG
MPKFSRTRNRSRLKGTSAVEFAVVAPIVLALIFGSFELTRVIMVKQVMTNAAREGCRTATLATTQNTTRAENAVRERLEGVVYGTNEQDQVDISFSPATFADLESQTPITTTVEVGYADISLLPDWILGNSTLRVAVTMERE